MIETKIIPRLMKNSAPSRPVCTKGNAAQNPDRLGSGARDQQTIADEEKKARALIVAAPIMVAPGDRLHRGSMQY